MPRVSDSLNNFTHLLCWVLFQMCWDSACVVECQKHERRSILLGCLLFISRMVTTVLKGFPYLLSSLQSEECTRLVATILRFGFLKGKGFIWPFLLTYQQCLHNTSSSVCGTGVSGRSSPTIPQFCQPRPKLFCPQTTSDVTSKEIRVLTTCVLHRLMLVSISLYKYDLNLKSHVSIRQQRTVYWCIIM